MLEQMREFIAAPDDVKMKIAWEGALTDECIAATILRRRAQHKRMTELDTLREKQKLYKVFGLPFSETEKDAIWRLENPEAAKLRDAIRQISSAIRTYEGMAKGMSYSDARGICSFSDSVLLEKYGIITKQGRRWIICANADVTPLRERLTQLTKRFGELTSRTDLVA
jgi:hypothetical protein